MQQQDLANVYSVSASLCQLTEEEKSKSNSNLLHHLSIDRSSTLNTPLAVAASDT